MQLCVDDAEGFQDIALTAVVDGSVEPRGHAPLAVRECAGQLLVDVVADRVEFAHVVSISNVDGVILAGSDGELTHVTAGIGLIGQEKHATRSEVGVIVRLGDRVRCVEVVRNSKFAVCGGDFHEGISIVAVDGETVGVKRRVEAAVRVEEIDVASVAGQTGSGHPD